MQHVDCCMLLADAGEFNSQYGHSDDYSLSDALWTCSNMFSTAYVVTDSVLHVLFFSA